MMMICEVRDECPDNTYPVVMEDCVNKSINETHRDISEHDKESNWYDMRMLIEKFLDGHNDDEKIKHKRKITKK